MTEAEHALHGSAALGDEPVALLPAAAFDCVKPGRQVERLDLGAPLEKALDHGPVGACGLADAQRCERGVHCSRAFSSATTASVRPQRCALSSFNNLGRISFNRL